LTDVRTEEGYDLITRVEVDTFGGLEAEELNLSVVAPGIEPSPRGDRLRLDVDTDDATRVEYDALLGGDKIEMSSDTEGVSTNLNEQNGLSLLSSNTYGGVDCGGVTYDGSGTSSDPYLVDTPEKLQCISDDPTAAYEVTTDIDASETEDWDDGAGFEPIDDFSGVLDGNGNTVEGIRTNLQDRAGLFNRIDGGEVTDLEFELKVIDDGSGFSDVGGLSGNGIEGDARVEGVSYTLYLTDVDELRDLGGLASEDIEDTALVRDVSFRVTADNLKLNGEFGGIAGDKIKNSASLSNVVFLFEMDEIELSGDIGGIAENTIEDSAVVEGVSFIFDMGDVTANVIGGLANNDVEDSAVVEDVRFRFNASDITADDIGGLVSDDIRESAEVRNILFRVDADSINGDDVGGVVGNDVRGQTVVRDILYAFPEGAVDANNFDIEVVDDIESSAVYENVTQVDGFVPDIDLDIEIGSEEPEILSVSRGPDVAESDEPVTVEAEVENVGDDGEVSLTYSEVGSSVSQTVPMNNPDGDNTYSTTISGTGGEWSIGSETEYTVEAENDAGSDESDEFSFYAFKTVEEVAVVYAKYSDSDEDGVPEPMKTGEDLREDQEFKQERINEYMAGWEGSWGAVGFNLTFFDNGGEWYTLDKGVEYYDEEGRSSFRREAMDIPIDRVEDIRATRDDDNRPGELSDEGSFDSAIAVSPGGTEYDDGGLFSSEIDNFTRAQADRDEDLIFVDEVDDNYPTWLHELIHTLGHLDLYEVDNERATSGEVGELGLMGSGNTDPPAPISIVSRTEYHRLAPELPKADRDEWPWSSIDSESTYFAWGFEMPVEPLENMEYGDSPTVYLTRDADTKYVFGARGTDENDVSIQTGVYVYRVEEVPPGDDSDLNNNPGNYEDLDTVNEIELIDDTLPSEIAGRPLFPTMDEEGDTLTVSPSSSAVSFEINDIDDDFNIDITVEEPELSSTTTGSTTDVDYPGQTPSNSEVPENFTPPRIDLHAYDSEGHHVGLNYTTGEFETEIPGVSEEDVSGPQRIFEWIGAPRSEDVRFEVDSRGVERYLQYLENEQNISVENDTTEFSLTIDEYGENATVNETSGEIEGLSSIETRLSIEPGETKTASAPADIDFEPETFNKRSKGRWVKVDVEIPNEGVSVENVNLSTVSLNGEVGAVDNDQYGFVRNPVERGKLTARFNRSETSEVLETGNETEITVIGATDEGRAFSGSDEIKVVDKGMGRGNKNGGNRGSRGRGPLR